MLLDRTKFGAILRGFSNNPAAVEQNVANLLKAAANLHAIHVDGHKFDRIDIMIPMDKRFGDCDCGETAAALKRALPKTMSDRVRVHKVMHGDIFVGLLNEAIAMQLRHRIDYSFIISHGVADYITDENIIAMLNCFAKGAKAVGLAINELTESVMQGRIADTFAAWDNKALATVGLFDARARKPRRDDKLAYHVQGFDKDKNAETFYHLAGVEEIIPLVRMIELYGPCIAPLLPKGGSKQWMRPDPVTDPDGAAREAKKMGTKFERQAGLATLVGADLSFLLGGVMPAYRTAPYF